MALASGQILQGRYRIVRPLGQGGMGAVYLAEDGRLSSRCAVKESVPDPNASLQTLAQIRQQFQLEAHTLAALNHPNLPKVTDYFSEMSNEYLVMEYVEGENLASILARHGGPLPEKPVLIWADQVLDALSYLHGQPNPIIHRDIKPANIILTQQGKIKLVDFGLVKLYDPRHPATATIITGMGTPEYTPLEQYPGSSSHTDARSDIYALGATLYHLLTGTPPPVAHQRILDPKRLLPPRQVNPALTPGVEVTILRALEVPPDQRWQTAHEMGGALHSQAPAVIMSKVANTPAVQSKASGTRWGWVATAGGALLLIAVLGLRASGLIGNSAAPIPTPTRVSAESSALPGSSLTASPASGLAITPTSQPLPTTVPPFAVAATLSPTSVPVPTTTATRPPTAIPIPTATASPPRLATATSRPSGPAWGDLVVFRPTQAEFLGMRNLWVLANYQDLQQPGTRTYDVIVNTSDTWRWGFSWHAADRERLREILRPLAVEFRINGARIPDELIYTFDETDADGWAVRRWLMGLRNWQTHNRVELEVRYSLSDGIYDGRNDFAPGLYRQIIWVRAQ